MRIKVLPLDVWMTHEYMLEDCLEGGQYAVVPVRFKRPGIYLEGDKCWFEVDANQAYSFDKGMFEYRLALESASRLNAKQASALKNIIEQRLASREQHTLYRHYQEAMDCRNVGRMARKSFLRISRHCD